MTGENGVYISSNVSLMQSEAFAAQVGNLQTFLSPQCKIAALPFICLYLFPLCDQNQTLHLPSSEQCISISTVSCKSEWTTAKALISNLPVCQSLPINSPNCNGK